ncbi:MAG TPA: DNA-directed RNA polymerase subunit omega [Pyrinomonadaceae bacterium]|nr:DNA-directed RNA polymerase subunit omega [Pyrinomonadaceae bacterium]
MNETGKSANDTSTTRNEQQWPGIDSRYRLIVVAAQRTKQLLYGSPPRIVADTRRSRNTSIALEEVRRGLVTFTISNEDGKGNGDGTSQTINRIDGATPKS